MDTYNEIVRKRARTLIQPFEIFLFIHEIKFSHLKPLPTHCCVILYMLLCIYGRVHFPMHCLSTEGCQHGAGWRCEAERFTICRRHLQPLQLFTKHLQGAVPGMPWNPKLKATEFPWKILNAKMIQIYWRISWLRIWVSQGWLHSARTATSFCANIMNLVVVSWRKPLHDLCFVSVPGSHSQKSGPCCCESANSGVSQMWRSQWFWWWTLGHSTHVSSNSHPYVLGAEPW